MSSCLLGAGTVARLEAQDVAVPAAIVTPAELSGVGVPIEPAAPPSTAAARADLSAAEQAIATARPSRRAFTSLYAALVATQALDAHSTIRALNAGHKEANPLMRWATSNPVALIGFKSVATATTILIIERVRKKHPVRALFLVAAVDSAYAVVVAHNYRAPVSNR
jgi:hypothetical protein